MKRKLTATTVAGLIFLSLLFIPESPPPLPVGAGREPFVWDRDEMWTRLEQRFVAAREKGCEIVRVEIDAALEAIDASLSWEEPPPPGDAGLQELESRLFEVAPLVAACTERVPELIALVTRLRAAVKDASRHWDAGSTAARRQVYRLLYGSRAAVEEVLLQLPPDEVPALIRGPDEPSVTPAAVAHGVRVHSGDILVSRGGAPVSALIARGNDYPGSFSHVALLHIDETSGEITIVESHIEEGVVLSSLDQYLAATKLRIMVLRPRSDLPALLADPWLPHRAASRALEETRQRHIPYDFEMDYRDPERQFCSEVASAAYAAYGVNLWQGLTSMSSRGVTDWLSALGVRHFETHGPSDLEYDPQLRVVAEWRDPETLYKDHVDSAVLDVLLEGAERGEELGYSWSRLPVARLAKAYSWTTHLLGRTGPIPEGISATVALRLRWFDRRHTLLERRTSELARELSQQRGYTTPYWELVRLARVAKGDN